MERETVGDGQRWSVTVCGGYGCATGKRGSKVRQAGSIAAEKDGLLYAACEEAARRWWTPSQAKPGQRSVRSGVNE